MSKLKYKVGDRVRIKSLGWYNKNKNNYGAIYAGSGFCFWKNMARHCGEIMKITIVKVDPDDSNKGYYFMENSEERWTDEMIEGLVEEETKPIDFTIKATDTKGKVEVVIPDGYSYVIENDKLYFVTEKKEVTYPKTYAECCRVLGVSEFEYNHTGTKMWYRHKLMATLDNLILCRDAYWKVAGEEMGLGKPWEPDWENSEERRYCIVNINGEINLPEKILTKWILKVTNKILVFPTEEMRDAFYENFKELIESTKELL